jgi:hypothetical protein
LKSQGRFRKVMKGAGHCLGGGNLGQFRSPVLHPIERLRSGNECPSPTEQHC